MVTRRQVLRGALAAGTIGGLAGCTGGSGGGGSTVTMKDTAFHPVRISVASGTTVTWTNEDSFGHTVAAATFTDGASQWSFETDTLNNGDTATHTFDQQGVYEYYCTIHGKDTMCGVVLVGGASLDATLPCESGSSTGSGGGGGYS